MSNPNNRKLRTLECLSTLEGCFPVCMFVQGFTVGVNGLDEEDQGLDIF
jgi:hypothetical protein